MLHRTSSSHAPRGLSDIAGATGHVRVRLGQAGRWVLLLLIRFYMMFLSPFFGGTCKFYPSCSNYAWEAISQHGARRGVALALKRLLRCHPFTKGGVDLVPEPESDCQTELAVTAQGKPFGVAQDKPFAGARGPQELAR